MLVVDYGPREAARRMNLNENTVLQWTKRNQWLESTKPTPAINPLPLSIRPVINVITPSVAHQIALSEDRVATKAAASRAARRAFEDCDNLSPKEIRSEAGKLRDLSTVAEKSQDWASGQQAVTVNVFQAEQPADAIEI